MRKMTATKHEGINVHRLDREWREKLFADEWAMRAPTLLGYLLCGQDRRDHEYSQRDATVAATVIQWLGSHVGQGFLRDVAEKANQRAEEGR